MKPHLMRTNVTIATQVFEQNDLVKLLAEIVAKNADMPVPNLPGIVHHDTGVRADVRFETTQQDGYGTRYRAVVKVTRDHDHVAAERAKE